jgi:hypothetical protein
MPLRLALAALPSGAKAAPEGAARFVKPVRQFYLHGMAATPAKETQAGERSAENCEAGGLWNGPAREVRVKAQHLSGARSGNDDLLR